MQTPKGLYKYLLREIGKLPKDAQLYYRHFVRQQYNSHSDETDSERIGEIIKQAVKDADWLVYVKYGVKK